MRPVQERDTGSPIDATAARTEHGGDSQADLTASAEATAVRRRPARRRKVGATSQADLKVGATSQADLKVGATGGGFARARAVVDGARAAGRSALFEHEGYAVLAAFGVPCPRHVFAAATAPVSPAAFESFPGTQLVVKAVAPALLHKSAAGGVVLVPRADVCRAAADLRERFGPHGLTGILVAEFVAHERQLGQELLIAARHTREFGPIVTVSPGGAGAELVASSFRASTRVGVVHGSWPAERLRAALGRSAIVRIAMADPRAGGAGMSWSMLEPVLRRMLRLALALGDLGLHELEVNPFVAAADRLVAVDALGTLGDPDRPTPPRPLDKMHRLLRPGRVAIAGVSAQVNPGHVILRNLLRDGIPREAITIVKPGADEIEGCRAVPSVAALDPPVDLLVLAVPAVQAASMLLDATGGGRAESIVLIPGGFEEKGGAEGLASGIRSALDRARTCPSRGPIVLGGNCLGFRSRPGRCDTLFIPDHKLATASAAAHPLAVVAQSGAFAISRADRWQRLVPRYVLTTGNQIDLTLGDCLTWLQDDKDIHVFALYVEGFKPIDGWRTLAAIEGIARSGRTVVVYRAGRTAAGVRASASHTASIAGDYLVTRALFEEAGACVADTIERFEDVVYLATILDGRRPAGGRVAAVSNAGFECVAMADWAEPLRLAALAPGTTTALRAILSARHIDAIVDVHNPLDLTPMADAATYEAAMRTVLGDPAIDLAVLGCIPFAPALDTLRPGPGHSEDLAGPDALPARLGRIRAEAVKPFVVVVDAGARYEAFAAAIEQHDIPVFRTADRAMRAVATWLGTSAAAS